MEPVQLSESPAKLSPEELEALLDLFTYLAEEEADHYMDSGDASNHVYPRLELFRGVLVRNGYDV